MCEEYRVRGGFYRAEGVCGGFGEVGECIFLCVSLIYWGVILSGVD